MERDPLDKTFQEITKHYAIYEKGTDKSSIYRHFLILPNGAVIEIFDQFANVQSSKFQGLFHLLMIF